MAKLSFETVLFMIINSALLTSAGVNIDTLQKNITSDSNSSSEYIYEYNSGTDGAVASVNMLNRIGLIIIAILGIFGNTVIIIVLTNKRNRSFTTSMYLTSLAVSEILLVVSSPFLDWIDEYFRVKTFIPIKLYCKLVLTSLYTTAMNSSWTLAVIAIERVISIILPHKVKIICSPYNAKRVIVGIWLAFIIFSFTLGLALDNSGENDCVFISEFYSFYVFDLSIISLAFMVPFLIICISTFIIVVHLFKIKRKKMSTKSFDFWQITVTLVFTNIAFIATVMPINIVFMIYKIQGFLGVEQIGNIYFLMNIFRFLLYSNACLNFFIYFLSGSRFRAGVIELFFCSKKTSLESASKKSTTKTV